jgi:raffinose/stachyose/melibiose transport system permease protein
MNQKSKAKITPGSVILTIVLGLWSLIQIFPLYWMLTFSLKSNPEIFGGNVIGLPNDWLWSNYADILQTGNMFKYLMNSAIVTGATIFFTVIAATGGVSTSLNTGCHVGSISA